MKSLNPNIFPKGGYFFRDSDGAKIFADSWPGVIRRVEAYRKRAGYPPGNPTDEVIAQVCARDGTVCVETTEAYASQLRKTSLKGRVLQYLNRLRQNKTKEPPAFVDESEARRRAAVCAKCPKNTALPGGCASCKAAVTEMRKDLLGPKFIDGRLEACIILGEDLPVSSHLDQQTVIPEELPGDCWRKRVL